MFWGLMSLAWGHLEGRRWARRKTQGCPLCSENAFQKGTLLAPVQGREFCKWRKPKPPPFHEVDPSMEGWPGCVCLAEDEASAWMWQGWMGEGA